jgi:hypothetical protein
VLSDIHDDNCRDAEIMVGRRRNTNGQVRKSQNWRMKRSLIKGLENICYHLRMQEVPLLRLFFNFSSEERGVQGNCIEYINNPIQPNPQLRRSDCRQDV